MESIVARLMSYLPKPLLKTVFKNLYSVKDNDSRVVGIVVYISKRIFLVLSCVNLVVFTTLVYIVSFLFGKWLFSNYHIVFFEVFEQTEIKEDPGVIEMRALLRGEDCFDYNLNQSQRRPNVPAHFNPYREKYLARTYTAFNRGIIGLLQSIKEHDDPFAQMLNKMLAWFDDNVVSHLTSHLVLNKRY